MNACKLLTMTPRTYVGLRLAASGIETADEIAKEHDLTRSEVLRLAIAAGFAHRGTLDGLIKKTKEQL